MERFQVFVKKSGKWECYSDHQSYDYAEINAQVQFQSGLESKVEDHKGKVILHLRKEGQ